ncbi:hypothetical protein GCM10029964_082750 [Kibdelosporangium lantanae]
MAVVSGFVLWSDGRTPETGTLRFGFESRADNWTILWGAQKATAGVTEDRHYEGTHSFQVSMKGPSMDGPGRSSATWASAPPTGWRPCTPACG